MENYHLVPMDDDKKHYVRAFHQKINNDGLWPILIQGCRNLKIMDFVERNYRIWKTTIKCLWLMAKNIMYGHSTKISIMMDYGLF